MRNPVHRFEIDLKDPYESARGTVMSPRPSRAAGWLLTVAALILGCTLGWYVSRTSISSALPDMTSATSETADGIVEPGNPVRDKGSPSTSTFTDPRPGAASPYDRPTSMAVETLSKKAWPIVVHRAGDGGFYADMLLDDRIVMVRIDPAISHSRLVRGDLPIGSGDGVAEWQATDVVLEHLRLPASRFAVVDEPDAVSTIGSDLLSHYFVIDEQADRLRLSPRRVD